MKTCIKILFLLMMPAICLAQQSRLDSLKKALKTARTDSARFKSLMDLGWAYSEINRDTGLYFHDQAFTLAKKNAHMLDQAWSLLGKGYELMHLGKFPESLACFQEGLKLAEDPANEKKGLYGYWSVANAKVLSPHTVRIAALASLHHNLGHLMGTTGSTDEQIVQYRIAKALAAQTGGNYLMGLVNMNLGFAYLKLNQLDSALMFEQNAERIMTMPAADRKYLGYVYRIVGQVYLKKQNKELAIKYFHKETSTSLVQKNFGVLAYGYSDLTDYYLGKKQKDSSLYYATKELDVLQFMKSKDLDQAYEHLYQSYKLAAKTDSAYKYQGLALAAKDSSFKATIKSLADFQKLSFRAQIHAQELEKEQAAAQTKIRTYVLLAGIAVLLLLAGIFYSNNRQKQKVNNVLSQQKEEIASQRDNLENTLSDLKATQTQLIQSEKMASLGELTAGIAHEIQNPLNFVNNFSEVNTEMLEELKAESKKPKAERDEQLEIELINDLIQNEQKINHHGKRADFIVKGMLEHSRTNTGEKQLTDMNVLCDEFLNLSYHGLRAKDKSFNAEMVTHFDPNLPKVNVSQQDMGRVMLNLFNNAFYAVNLKKKTAGMGYNPEVSVTTSTDDGQIIIKVKDNGIGMPEQVKEKIMQPFFTTKPTGEGTGLGLSLTYDMVVKGHGGSIQVNSIEGEGSEFIIALPIS
jgi:two-component system, NtrC family, sensor kinase